MAGKFILVIGPSGSGKGTLINHVRPLFSEVAYPKSMTTRARRGGESDKNYVFLSHDDFSKKIKNGELLEWAEYGGNYYGTPVEGVVPLLEAGQTVLKELEVQGVRQIRQKIPKEQLVVIFVNAGGWAEMEARIRARADMPEAELEKRRVRYEDELAFLANEKPDYVIPNPTGKVEEAKKRFEEVIRSLI